MPLSTLHGVTDRAVPLEMHAALPGSTLRTFPGGHLFFLFRQRHLVAAVLADTATTDSPGSRTDHPA